MNKIKLGVTFLASVSALLPSNRGNFETSKNTPLFKSGDNVRCEIEYVNVAFANGPYLLYAVKVENSDICPSMYVWTAGDGTYDLEDAIKLDVYQKNVLIGGESYTTFVYDQIGAKEMTDYIYAKAYVDDVASPLFRYSVLEYSKQVISNHGKNDSLSILLSDMLQYGESAQKHFNYHTDRLPSDDYYTLYTENCLLEDGFSNGIYTNKETITLHTLDGSSLNWFVYQDGEYSGLSNSDTLVLHGIDAETMVTANKSPVRFDFSSDIATLVNGEPFFINHVYANDATYSLVNNVLTIGSNEYSYEPYCEIIDQSMNVTEVCSDPKVFKVSYSITTSKDEALTRLISYIEENKKNMFYDDYTYSIEDANKISEDMANMDDDDAFRKINDLYLAIKANINRYRPYLDQLNELEAYAEENLIYSYYDYDKSLETCRSDVYFAHSKEEADEIIATLWEEFYSKCEEYQSFEAKKQKYLTDGNSLRLATASEIQNKWEDAKKVNPILDELNIIYYAFRTEIENARQLSDLDRAFGSLKAGIEKLRFDYGLQSNPVVS